MMTRINLSDRSTSSQPQRKLITLHSSINPDARQDSLRPSAETTNNSAQTNGLDVQKISERRARIAGSQKSKIWDSKFMKNLHKFLPVIIFFLSLSGMWFGAKNLAKGAGLDITLVDTLTSVTDIGKAPELKKDSSGKYTNILVVGKDTRETNSGLQNTDTVMMISYNHTDNQIVMISIPRDFYAGIPGENWYVKINSIYNRYEQQKEGTGLPALVSSVEEILGQEIQYYGMVDLAGFKEVIGIVGGIDVYVDRSFTDHMYPNPNGSGTMTVSFKEGAQTMNADTALVFARSRQSQGPEGSDYARARRQQKVIIAVLNKVASTQTLLNPDKVLSLAQSLSDNTEVSSYTLEEVKAGLAMVEKVKNADNHSFVLDPLVGNSKLVKTKVAENAYSIGPVQGLGKYNDIHTYIDLVLENPGFFSENATIYVYDIGLGYAQTSKATSALQKQYPFHKIIFGGTLKKDQTENYVFYNDETEKKDATFTVMKDNLKILNTTKPDFITTKLNGEDIAILLSTDPTTKTEDLTQN